jgi:hypothetical protein
MSLPRFSIFSKSEKGRGGQTVVDHFQKRVVWC